MKLHLTFEEKDFENLRAFDKAVKRQLGPNVYVSGNSLCFYFDYPPQLVDQLRPFAPNPQQMEFELDSSCPDEKKGK